MEAKILTHEGTPTFAVISYADYKRLLELAELAEDRSTLDAAKRALENGEDEILPAEMVDRLLDGENPLKVWRGFRGFTQRQLAERAGITTAHVSQIEGGKREASVKVLRKLADALDVDLDDLVPRAED